MARRKQFEVERWWVTFEHPRFGEAMVCFRWVASGRGTYAAIVEAFQFDLMCPKEEQDALVAVVREAQLHRVGQDA